MMDIAYGFRAQSFKNARKTYEIYALVIVCILTGATSILVLEGLETQDVIHALERHSARHGVPAHIFIDNGTQLKALKHAKFSIQQLNTQVQDSMGMEVSVSNPKSHEERGRVERKIGLIRETLERSMDQSNVVQTSIQWETLFSKIANTLDDLPLAKGNSTNQSFLGFEILTANRIKLGRNNNRSLVGSGMTIDLSPSLTKLLEKNRKIYHCWYQLFIDNIHALNLRPSKWPKSSRQPAVGDIVLFVYNDAAHCEKSRKWKLGKVLETTKNSVKIQFVVQTPKTQKMVNHTADRNPRDVSLILSLEEIQINSKEYFKTPI